MGRYVTKKPDPRDVDVVLLVSPAVLRVPTMEDMATLKRYMTRDGRREIRSKWQVDFYIANANSSTEHDYWLDQLSRNPDQSNRKGFLRHHMNFPTEIPELEAELGRLRGIQDEQKRSLAESTMPEVDGIFLASTALVHPLGEVWLHGTGSHRCTLRSAVCIF